MKKLLFLILAISLLTSCNDKKTEKTQVEIELKTELKSEKVDTTVVYWQTNFDTIKKTQEIYIGNDKHELELKTYSLNDSSIVKTSENYKEIYHDNVTEIIIKKGKELILKSLVKKSTFKDSLDGDFLKYSVLRSVEYDNIRSNRLYFKADIDVPDTDWAFGVDFAVFYQTDKKGQIDFWNVKEIGL